MRGHERMTRARPISSVGKPAANRKAASRGRRGRAVRFLTFGEDELREFNRSVLPMRIFDRETLRYLAVNDAALKLYGYTREEFLALTLKDTRHPEEHSEILPTLAEPTGYLTHRGPRRHVKKSGEVIIVELVSQDIVFKGREARLSAIIDVTERERAEEELARQKKLLDAIVDHLPVGVFIKDAKTFRYVLRNRFNRKVFGSLVHDYAGKTAHELFPKAQADEFIKTDREAVETRRMLEIREQQVLGSSGDVRIQHVRKLPLLDENGEPWLIVGISDDITERKRAEQALRESNEFLRSVIESSRDCIKVLDLDGRLLWINETGRRLLEIDDVSALDNRSYLDFWNGPDREKAQSALASARAGNASSFEGYGPTIKGGPKWWDEIMTPMLDADGRPEKLLVVSRDITRRKEIECALQESESKYRNLVESSSDLIWSADAEGRITFINQAARRIYGYEPEEMLGRPVSGFLGDESPKKAFGFFREMLAEGRSWADYECEVRRKDGEPVVLSSNAIVLRDAEGKRIGVTGISKDITARKLTEAALRQSEERFRQLAENIRQVFWIATLSGDKVIYVSPAYQEIWGRSREGLYRDSRDWLRSIHPEDLPVAEDSIKKQARGECHDIEYRIIRPDGTVRWIRDRSYHMRGGDGMLLACGIAEDVTDWRRAEQERLAHAIRQRDALVREVHHRIKNNLQGVVGLLRQLAADDPSACLVIDKAVSQLQAVAVVYGLEARRVRRAIVLRDILLAIGTAVQSMTGAELKLDFGPTEDARVQLAETEAVALALVLNELLTNAARSSESMPESGGVSVNVCTKGESLRVTISNPGRLPPQFDFARARGLGTGLELVRSLLPQHGVRLTFTEAAGRVNAELEISAPVLVTQGAPALAAQH